jgi:hypothetical protein
MDIGQDLAFLSTVFRTWAHFHHYLPINNHGLYAIEDDLIDDAPLVIILQLLQESQKVP